jgi:hypothetical protein
MEKVHLDSQTPANHPPSGRFEFLLLIGLTVVPLMQMFGVLAAPMETPAGTVLWCIWVGTGSVLPWRYARRGKYPVWACILGVIALFMLLWVLVLEAYWRLARLMAW